MDTNQVNKRNALEKNTQSKPMFIKKTSPVKVESKISLANICHKNTSGANNWIKFLEMQSPKSSSRHKSRSNFSQGKQSSLGTSSSKQTLYEKKAVTNLENLNINRPISSDETNIYSCLTNSLKPNTLFKTDTLFANCKGKSNLGAGSKPDQVKNGYNSNIRIPQTFPSDKSKAKISSETCSLKDETRVNKPKITKQVALDCEMVGVEVGIDNSIVARVSLVNAEGDCIYDTYVQPSEPVLDYRTKVSGIRPEDLENAPDFKTVQREVADIIKGRVLVGHALKHDLQVLLLTHPKHLIRDTSKFKKFRVGRTPALKKLAKMYLGVTIQEGEHSSVQDALAAMQLYRMFRKEWEATLQKNIKRPKPLGVGSKKMQHSKDITSSIDT